MASMSIMTATAPLPPLLNGANVVEAGADAGLDQLFVQILQKLQRLLEKSEGGADGSALPLDGDLLPPEMPAELIELTQQDDLSASQQLQLTELVEQLVAEGVPPEQVRQLAQTALLLQDAQRSLSEGLSANLSPELGSNLIRGQSADEKVDQVPALMQNPLSRQKTDQHPSLLELVEQIRTAPQPVDQQQPAERVDARSVDELLRLAQTLRKHSVSESVAVETEPETLPMTALAANDRRTEDLRTISQEGSFAQSVPTAPLQAQAFPEAQGAGSSNAEEITDLQQIDLPPTRAALTIREPVLGARVGPGREGVAVSNSGSSSAVHSAESAQNAASVVDSGSESGASDGKEARRDGLREQGLARWVELRDAVFAQGQKLLQNETAIKEMSGAQVSLGRGEAGSLAPANPSAGLMQLQQVYQTPATTGMLLGERFGSQSWTPAASQRISWMAGQHISTAELRLDPPELGSLRIKLTIQGDQTSLSFTSPHAQVREVLEQQMPRLRDMLAESGLELGQTDVSDQPQGTKDDRQGGSASAGRDGQESENQPDTKALLAPISLALVDYYA